MMRQFVNHRPDVPTKCFAVVLSLVVVIYGTAVTQRSTFRVTWGQRQVYGHPNASRVSHVRSSVNTTTAPVQKNATAHYPSAQKDGVTKSTKPRLILHVGPSKSPPLPPSKRT